MPSELGGFEPPNRSDPPRTSIPVKGFTERPDSSSNDVTDDNYSATNSLLVEGNSFLQGKDDENEDARLVSGDYIDNSRPDQFESSRAVPKHDDELDQAAAEATNDKGLIEGESASNSHSRATKSSQREIGQDATAASLVGSNTHSPSFAGDQEIEKPEQVISDGMESEHLKKEYGLIATNVSSHSSPAVHLEFHDTMAESDDSDASLPPDDAMFFRNIIKRQESPSNTSSRSEMASPRGISLSRSNSQSGSPHSFNALQRNPSPSPMAKASSISLNSSRSGSPSLNRTNASDDGAISDASLLSARSQNLPAKKGSPLDNLDELLANHSSSQKPVKPTNTRLPLRLGLLSFDEQDYDDVEHSNGTMGGVTNDRWKRSITKVTSDGVRRHEDRIRKLETENMELRLKLQQYREMNASEQEITRVKWQVDRAERRIDELEQALERKNRTIAELSEERDLLASKVRPDNEIEDLQETISDLQTAITELESQSLVAEKAEQATSTAISELHKLMPTLIAPDAAIDDLVSALKDLNTENRQLAEINAECEKLSKLLDKTGRTGYGPVAGVELLIQENAALQHELKVANEAMSHERKQSSHDMDLLKESHRQQVDSFLFTEDKLRQQLAKAQDAQAVLEEKIGELEEIVENQHRIISDTRADNYSIVRRFFSELIEVMGAEFQSSVETELQSVIEKAQTQGVSKLPLLTDLMLRYTRELAEEAVKSYTAPAVELKVRAMEQEVQSLEHMLSLKLDKSGADAILLAQNRDLRRALKLEQEKRKTDWNEYTKTIAAIR